MRESEGLMSAVAAVADGLPAKERVMAMTAVLIAIGLATLDTAIVNTALPAIARDLGASAASSVWIVSAYQIVTVATLLPLAAIGEIAGHRRVYLAGIVLFTIMSLACGVAWSLPALVTARVLQGLGGAALMSVNTALIRFIYPSRMLGRGLGLNALAVGIAFTVGPTVASAVLSVTTWHWLFLINVPAGFLAVSLGLRTLPATETTAKRLDPVASLLCAGLFGCLIHGLGAFAHGGSGKLVALELAVAVFCLVALLRREAGLAAPMLAMDLFKRPVFALSAATAVCAFAAQGLAFVSLPFLFQDVLGRSQVETGLLMTPWPAVVALTALVAGRLSDRYPPGLLGGLGLFVLAAGMASLALLPSNPGTLDVAWRTMLCGAGFGFFQSPNLKAIMTGAPASRSGSASGIVATVRLLGQSIGAALVALCLSLSMARGAENALWMGCAFAAAGCVASFLRLLPARHAG